MSKTTKKKNLKLNEDYIDDGSTVPDKKGQKTNFETDFTTSQSIEL
jgi:hypothetical protein